MEPIHWATVGGVLICWTVLAVTVTRWGPGVRRRRVKCPEKNQRASVLIELKEVAYGVTQAVDIKACSFFPHGDPINCDKRCLQHL